MKITKIFKYQLGIEGGVIAMPVGATILSVQNQKELVALWALVDPEETKTENRVIETYGTGHEIRNTPNTERKFLATLQFESGAFILHVFERLQ